MHYQVTLEDERQVAVFRNMKGRVWTSLLDIHLDIYYLRQYRTHRTIRYKAPAKWHTQG